jgi:hypothetical protein
MVKLLSGSAKLEKGSTLTSVSEADLMVFICIAKLMKTRIIKIHKSLILAE